MYIFLIIISHIKKTIHYLFTSCCIQPFFLVACNDNRIGEFRSGAVETIKTRCADIM